MAPSPSAGCLLYRRENDSIAIRCGVAPSPSAHCLAMERLHRHSLSHCDMAPSPSAGRQLYRSIARSPQGEPRGYTLTIRWTFTYIALSHFLECSALFQTTLSVSFECTSKIWWSRTLECPVSYSHGIVAVACPFNWHVTSEASQVAYR
jgi:hypothetical protein